MSDGWKDVYDRAMEDVKTALEARLAEVVDILKERDDGSRFAEQLHGEWTGINDAINTLRDHVLDSPEPEPCPTKEVYCLECSEAAEHHSYCDDARSASVYHAAPNIEGTPE